MVLFYYQKFYDFVDYEPPQEIGWGNSLYYEYVEKRWKECKKILVKSKRVCIHTCSSIIKGKPGDIFFTDLFSIIFSEKLVLLANRILKQHEKWVGVHIRRTDNGPATICSTNESFIAEMDRVLGADRDVYFFLATDDKNVEIEFKKKYADRIVTQENKLWGRDFIGGMESAVIDLLCLAGCKMILGSYRSTFTKFAAKYGKCELIICKEKEI